VDKKPRYSGTTDYSVLEFKVVVIVLLRLAGFLAQ